MPEIDIRPAAAQDIAAMIALDHDYTSDFVWQMDILVEEGSVGVGFRQTRLPRSVRVEYPRPPRSLATDWEERACLLVALMENQIIGYISVMQNMAPVTSWVTDLVVVRRLRRQGIGSALLLAAQDWSRQLNINRMVLEMQPKNYAMLSLAQKLGFDFCGYHDRYYANHDIALFFAKSMR